MNLLTAADVAQLRANSIKAETERHLESFDPQPVVKLFTPDAQCTWLLTEIDEDGDRMFGLCDIGHGEAELGYVLLSELTAVRGGLGLRVEKDLGFKADKTLRQYTEIARREGRIVT